MYHLSKFKQKKLYYEKKTIKILKAGTAKIVLVK